MFPAIKHPNPRCIAAAIASEQAEAVPMKDFGGVPRFLPGRSDGGGHAGFSGGDLREEGLLTRVRTARLGLMTTAACRSVRVLGEDRGSIRPLTSEVIGSLRKSDNPGPRTGSEV